ncbi:MAPEG family protein [Aestuariibius sp. HNIBRBA575]|uniref:MAPEG family protein n=1 Tax=Aestuariibius sp. HNIBRBA575 TaxID=3233343 RepID=UPI0034A1C270
MTTELVILTLAALLQVVQFMLYSVLANMQVTPRVALGPRDKPVTLSGYAGRAQRAMNNHFEGLILFSIAALVVTLGDKTTGLTAICAWTYLAARIAYIPAYMFGLTPWRTLIWCVGFGATTLMLLSALI